jgi:hypothetical protein
MGRKVSLCSPHRVGRVLRFGLTLRLQPRRRRLRVRHLLRPRAGGLFRSKHTNSRMLMFRNYPSLCPEHPPRQIDLVCITLSARNVKQMMKPKEGGLPTSRISSISPTRSPFSIAVRSRSCSALSARRSVARSLAPSASSSSIRDFFSSTSYRRTKQNEQKTRRAFC